MARATAVGTLDKLQSGKLRRPAVSVEVGAGEKGPHGGHGSTAALVLGKINPARAEAKEHGQTGQTSFSKEVMKGNEMQHVGGNKKRKAGCRRRC